MERNQNLIWVDVETTGLSYNDDYLLEAAFVATDADLNVVGDPFHIVIPFDVDHAVNDFVIPDVVLDMHEKNGLWAECKEAADKDEFDRTRVEQAMLRWLGQYPPSPMAGASVHFDRTWLRNWFYLVEESFHYRNFDVTTLKSMCMDWFELSVPEKEDAHRSLPDIENEIEEAKWIRNLLATAPWAG